MAADDKNIKNGVRTVELELDEVWKEFDRFVCTHMKDGDPEDPICWRGQPDDRPMISLFDRMLGEANTPDRRPKSLGDHRRFSAYAYRGVLQNPSIREMKQAIREGHLNENHFWAIGQHFDLATPLLDWSLSPFIAAFFAFEEERKVYEKGFEEKSKQWFDEHLKVELNKWCKKCRKKSGADQIDVLPLWKELKRKLFPDHRLVYALKYKKLQKKSMQKAGKIHKRTDEEEVYPHMRRGDTSQPHTRATDVPGNLKTHRREDDPAQIPYFQWFDPLSCEHGRLLNQRGIFTITPNGESVEQLVESLFPRERKEWVLLKIGIPSTQNVRDDFLEHLNWMNINRLSLFPDLLGASKYSNRELEWRLACRQA